MKFNIKSFIMGFICSSVLLSITSIAYAQNKNIEAFYNDIKLMVNGKIVDTKQDAPFIYNGRTYTPSRYVAEALGATVKWNETTNTVEVTNDKQNTNTVVTENLNSNTNDVTTIKKDGFTLYVFNDNQYISSTEINNKYRVFPPKNKDTVTFLFNEKNILSIVNLYNYNNVLIPNIKYTIISGNSCFEYNYFIEILKPLFDKNLQN